MLNMPPVCQELLFMSVVICVVMILWQRKWIRDLETRNRSQAEQLMDTAVPIEVTVPIGGTYYVSQTSRRFAIRVIEKSNPPAPRVDLYEPKPRMISLED